MSFSFQELEIFKAVAECGGITRAAARLHRVQSNVTTRLKQLEARLGAPFTANGLEAQHVYTEELVLISPLGFDLKSAPHAPILGFAAGCSYRRRLEAWLARSAIAPERVMEYGSYHAILACVAAGCGIAV